MGCCGSSKLVPSALKDVDSTVKTSDGSTKSLGEAVNSAEPIGEPMLVEVSLKGASKLVNPNVLDPLCVTFDPYALVKIGKRTRRTPAVKGVDPIWNSAARFFVRKGMSKNEWSVEVHDENILKDSIIGTATLPVVLASLARQGAIQVCLQLKNKKDEPVGTLDCNISIVPMAEAKQVFWASFTQVVDTNGDNYITEEELSKFLGFLKHEKNGPVATAILEKTFAEVATDADGIKKRSVEEVIKELAATELPLLGFNESPLTGRVFPANAKTDQYAQICYLLAEMIQAEYGEQMVPYPVDHSTYLKRGWLSCISEWKVIRDQGDSLSDFVDGRLVKDRKTGQSFTENVPAGVWLALKTSYCPIFSSAVMGATTKRITAAQVIKNDPESKKDIPDFVKTYQLDMTEAKKSLEEFTSMNDFFVRELKPEARPIDQKDNEKVMTSCADCRLMCFPTVDVATKVWVKGDEFSVESLVDDKNLASRMEGGSMVIFRLAPQDYHRYHFPVSGKLVESRSLDGEYFTVNPIAVNHDRVNVFTKNRRVVNIIETNDGDTIVLIAVGATCVGSIVQLVEPGSTFTKGDCFGYFQFGGSTCIMLTQPGRVAFDDDLLETATTGMELYVKMGECIGKCA